MDKDEIASGYKYSRNEYVIIEPEELAKLRGHSDKTISIEAFVPPTAADPIYYTDKSYCVLPDGEAAEKPYEVLYEAMREQEGHAIGKVVLFNRDHVAIVRPYDGLLMATVLTYAEHFKKPEVYEDEIPHAKASSKELELAKSLMAL